MEYYIAYNERYKRIHEEGLLWASEEPTPEVLKWIIDNNIDKKDTICEIGCGEGRDALFLASKGYKITGVDVSEEAIDKCNELSMKKELEISWIVDDIIYPKYIKDRKFKFIYSIGTLHMLVNEDHRKSF